MRYKKIFLISILIIVLLSFYLIYLAGVSPEIRDPPSGDAAWAVVETSDGGYAIAGETESFGAGFSDFWLVKTDDNGNMEWNQTYDGGDDDRAYSLVETSDEGYAMAGDISYSNGDTDAGWSEVWLVKTDANGNMQWNRTYGE